MGKSWLTRTPFGRNATFFSRKGISEFVFLQDYSSWKAPSLHFLHAGSFLSASAVKVKGQGEGKTWISFLKSHLESWIQQWHECEAVSFCLWAFHEEKEASICHAWYQLRKHSAIQPREEEFFVFIQPVVFLLTESSSQGKINDFLSSNWLSFLVCNAQGDRPR